MCYPLLVQEMLDLNSIMDLMIGASLLSLATRNRINAAHPQPHLANRDHPDKNRELLDWVMSNNRVQGRTAFCVFVQGLLARNQRHLAVAIADSLRIAWIRRDYKLGDGNGTQFTALRAYIVSLETLLLNYAPDARPLDYESPIQLVIRDAWVTNNLTLPQMNELIGRAFPEVYQFAGAVDEASLYQVLQRRDMQPDD